MRTPLAPVLLLLVTASAEATGILFDEGSSVSARRNRATVTIHDNSSMIQAVTWHFYHHQISDPRDAWSRAYEELQGLKPSPLSHQEQEWAEEIATHLSRVAPESPIEVTLYVGDNGKLQEARDLYPLEWFTPHYPERDSRLRYGEEKSIFPLDFLLSSTDQGRDREKFLLGLELLVRQFDLLDAPDSLDTSITELEREVYELIGSTTSTEKSDLLQGVLRHIGSWTRLRKRNRWGLERKDEYQKYLRDWTRDTLRKMIQVQLHLREIERLGVPQPLPLVSAPLRMIDWVQPVDDLARDLLLALQETDTPTLAIVANRMKTAGLTLSLGVVLEEKLGPTGITSGLAWLGASLDLRVLVGSVELRGYRADFDTVTDLRESELLLDDVRWKSRAISELEKIGAWLPFDLLSYTKNCNVQLSFPTQSALKKPSGSEP